MDASSKAYSLSDRLCTNTSPTGTPIFHTSSGSVETMMDEKDDEDSREWLSQVEPGVIFISRVDKVSREIFNEQAQCWWAQNCDKIMELYNVHARTKDKPAAVSTPPRSEDERDSKMRAESGTDSPVTPAMQNKTLLPGGSQASETSFFRDTDRSDDLQSKDNSSKQGHNRLKKIYPVSMLPLAVSLQVQDKLSASNSDITFFTCEDDNAFTLEEFDCDDDNAFQPREVQ